MANLKSDKANVLLVGGGGVGTIAALNIETGGLGVVTSVLRSNFEIVNQRGYVIQSVDHGQLHGWKPTKVTNSVPDVARDSLPPFDYVIATTKNCPDVAPTLPEVIAPAVTPGHTVIVMIQNGVNIERPVFERFPQNIVLSGVSMIGSHERQIGVISHVEPDILYLGAFHNPNFGDNKHEAAAAHEFIKIYGAGGKANVHFSDDVQWSRWRKLIFNGVLNPLCAITNMDTSRVRLTDSLVEGLVRPAMKEVFEVASKLGHQLPADIIDTMINLDPMDLYLEPSMLCDFRKGNLMEIEWLVGEPLREAEKVGIPAPNLKAIYETSMDKSLHEDCAASTQERFVPDMTTTQQPSSLVQSPPLSHNVSLNPTKLSRARKLHVLVSGLICTFNSSLGTSMPSGAISAIASQFNVSSQVHLSLLNSLNMAGFVLGPLLFGPLSEYIGRKPVLIVSFVGYIIFMLACSASPSYAVLLIFRLLCGINAAAPTTVVGGLFADILDDPSQRGTAIAVFLTVNTLGSLFGPMVSGFASRLSWRWPFWVAAALSAPGVPLLMMLPETFAPVLYNRQIRRQANCGDVPQGTNVAQLHPFDIQKIFLRPITFMVTEPVVLLTSLYLALAYSILYLMFQAYPIIFQVAFGAALALALFCIFAKWYHRSATAGKPWAQRDIYRRLPVACVAAPCMVISLFWLGWTSRETISPAVPASGGLFFGLGFLLLFASMLNYVTDMFREYSASAHAAASFTRSIGAVVLPLAAGPMYARLGIHWAPSVLGLIALVMGVIPFFFIVYGDTLARKSRFMRNL
ncbi:hypothetical protein NM208_g5242 [Fusarium decemcellulare]|uniref:Uncharacterized protein n=1 Tax=Fusarium decemcellulare TaxID=57161 RepID=A0ACC1SHM9_9HYPO|nr:hypothetical protein NM208_g5242 [Fusarium decemcellulare]